LDSSLSFQYPAWFLLLCVALGLIYAIALYFRDRSFVDASKGQRRLVSLMSIFRFLSATAIATLLLSPLIKNEITETQKPYIVILEDDSESVRTGFAEGDSSNYRQGIDALAARLEESNNVERLTFSSGLKSKEQPDYQEKVTNLSQTLAELYDRYSYQNVGAIILASDGIYNEGSNPIYSNLKLEAPLYTVALGDTTPTRDLKLDRVLHNRIAYQGDKFTIRVDYSATNCKDKSTVLTVYNARTGGKLFAEKINIKSERFFNSKEIILDAAEEGMQQYRISLSEAEGEITTANNTQSIYVEVLEGRQKVLILANSPHPDLSAFKKSIENGRNYEAEIKFIQDQDLNTAQYDLLILHGLPSGKQSASSVIDKAKSSKTPIWFVLTSQSNLGAFNQSQDLVDVAGSGSSLNAVKAITLSDFNLFTIDPNVLQTIESLPPLTSPYGKYTAAPTAQVLIQQEVSDVETDYPLLCLEQSSDYKTAVLSGEGFWRWRMYDYREDKNFETTDELVSKMIQYLVVKNDKRQFRSNVAKNLYNENEQIAFDAELYNDSYELINDPDARLKVKDEEGKEYDYTFSKTSNAYNLDAGILPVGNYTFTGSTVYNGKKLNSSGRFSIKELQLEAMQRTANHQLLFSLSDKYNGKMVNIGGLPALSEEIATSDAVKPVLYSSFKNREVINLKWLFFLLVGLLAAEWFVRKYCGGY